MKKADILARAYNCATTLTQHCQIPIKLIKCQRSKDFNNFLYRVKILAFAYFNSPLFWKSQKYKGQMLDLIGMQISNKNINQVQQIFATVIDSILV